MLIANHACTKVSNYEKRLKVTKMVKNMRIMEHYALDKGGLYN
jgi:hypothetical protein